MAAISETMHAHPDRGARRKIEIIRYICYPVDAVPLRLHQTDNCQQLLLWAWARRY